MPHALFPNPRAEARDECQLEAHIPGYQGSQPWRGIHGGKRSSQIWSSAYRTFRCDSQRVLSADPGDVADLRSGSKSLARGT